jgi:predicted nucleic acid-binding protein
MTTTVTDSEAGSSPLYVDTGPFYAQFIETASRHNRAKQLFEAIGHGTLPYRPLYTSTYVLDELATLVLSHETHGAAVAAVERVQESPTTVIHPTATDWHGTKVQFAQYEHPAISFTDHMSGFLARERDIEHVFTFDPDHFRTLGFTAVPDDTGAA